MISNFKFKSLNSEKGITLVEIVVVIFIITLFSVIIIADFPKIQRQFALSRAAYKLAQDLRTAQDLGLSGSGIQTTDFKGRQIIARGYGIYVNLADVDSVSQKPERYVIYADVPPHPEDPKSSGDKKYSGVMPYPLCNLVDQQTDGALTSDCVMEIIDVRTENPNLYIKGFNNINGDSTSINFTPPHPIIDIENKGDGSNNGGDGSKIGIVLGLTVDNSVTRTVWVGTSGLIEVK